MDLIDLRTATPLVLREVVRDGVPVFVQDEDERARFELRAVSTWLDTAHLRSVQQGYFRERVGERRARS